MDYQTSRSEADTSPVPNRSGGQVVICLFSRASQVAPTPLPSACHRACRMLHWLFEPFVPICKDCELKAKQHVAIALQVAPTLSKQFAKVKQHEVRSLLSGTEHLSLSQYAVNSLGGSLERLNTKASNPDMVYFKAASRSAFSGLLDLILKLLCHLTDRGGVDGIMCRERSAHSTTSSRHPRVQSGLHCQVEKDSFAWGTPFFLVTFKRRVHRGSSMLFIYSRSCMVGGVPD